MSERQGRPRWPGTLLYVPLLYGAGWLLARPLAGLLPQWRPDQVNLAGAALSLLLLLASLPWRLRIAWGCPTPWQRLGVAAAPVAVVRALLRGVLLAALLLAGVAIVLLATGTARWLPDLSGAELLNALALLLGVGFAEELVFRGWLWGELDLQMSHRRAAVLQALVFALVHPWFREGGLAALGLLGGLFLLGLALAARRRADGGVLWGAVGLHGGLVGGWFALQKGLIAIAPGTPIWLVGPGGDSPNPVGGVLGWLGLGSLLLVRNFSPSRAPRPAPEPPCCSAPPRPGADRSPPPAAGRGRRP
jgi:hypothetical protein